MKGRRLGRSLGSEGKVCSALFLLCKITEHLYISKDKVHKLNSVQPQTCKYRTSISNGMHFVLKSISLKK
jgi:hypothetical protein